MCWEALIITLLIGLLAVGLVPLLKFWLDIRIKIENEVLGFGALISPFLIVIYFLIASDLC